MRTLAVLVIGLVLGVVLAVGAIEINGGRYVYRTFDEYECAESRSGWEVVPHQPNRCHFRRPRWQLVR